MKTTSGSTDRVGNMIRQAGPEIPPPGMTERIMNRIEVVSLKKSQVISPVIGIRGWTWIGIFVIGLIVLSMHTGLTGAADGNRLWDAGNLLRSFPHPGKSMHIDFQVPKPLLFGLAGLLLWFSLDFLLSTLRWKKQVSKGKS